MAAKAPQDVPIDRVVAFFKSKLAILRGSEGTIGNVIEAVDIGETLARIIEHDIAELKRIVATPHG